MDLTRLPHKFARNTYRCVAIIETPKHRRNKFAYDPASNLFALKSSLPEGMLFPANFGFIPSTLGADGDPLDVLVLMDEPVHVGCLVHVQLVGVIEAEQTERGGARVRNDRLLAIFHDRTRQRRIRTPRDLDPALLAHLDHFFTSYNALRGTTFKRLSHRGPRRAADLLMAGITAFNQQQRP